MTKRERKPEVTVSALTPHLLAAIEEVEDTLGLTTSSAVKVLLARGAESMGLTPARCAHPAHTRPTPGDPLPTPLNGVAKPPAHTGPTPGSHPAPSPSHSPSPLEGGREPPASPPGGARLGGLAARREGVGAGRTAQQGPTLPEKVQALSAWRACGLTLPKESRDLIAKFEAGLAAGKARPVTKREARVLGQVYRQHEPSWGTRPPHEAVGAAQSAPDPEPRRTTHGSSSEASTAPRSGPTGAELDALVERNRAAVLERLRHPTRFNATETQLAPGDGAEEDAMERNRQALEELRREVAEGDAGGDS